MVSYAHQLRLDRERSGEGSEDCSQSPPNVVKDIVKTAPTVSELPESFNFEGFCFAVLMQGFKQSGGDGLGVDGLLERLRKFSLINPQLKVPEVSELELKQILSESERILLACNGERAVLKSLCYAEEVVDDEN